MNRYQKAFYNAMKKHPCVAEVRSKWGSGRSVAIVKLKPIEVTARDSGRYVCTFTPVIEIGINERGVNNVARWGDMRQPHPHKLGGGMCLRVNFSGPMEKHDYDAAIYELVAAVSATDERHAIMQGFR